MILTLCLCGFGNVGRHFVKLLAVRHEHIAKEYNLDIRISTVVGSNGGVYKANGLDLIQLSQLPFGSYGLRQLSDYWHDSLANRSGILSSGADILVEATPTDILTGEPGLSHFTAALSKKMDIVSFTKGPLVKSFAELANLARLNGAILKYSGATAAALPTVDIGLYCLAGDDLLSFEGVLNGTTNYILSRMTNENLDYLTALSAAQQKGIAEPNPRLDVEGWDTASKTVIIANSLFPASININEITVEGIQDITMDTVNAAKRDGNVLKLVGEARLADSGVIAKVSVKALPASHFLANVTGTNKGIQFITRNMGELAVTGGGSDPHGTAAAALKDIINIAREKYLVR